MSNQAAKHAPKHRAARHKRSRSEIAASRAPRRVLRNTVMLSSVAAAATAGVVSTGIATSPAPVSTASTPVSQPEPSDERSEAARASTPISRSAGRDDQAKDAPKHRKDVEKPAEDDLSDEDPRAIGMALLPEYGFSTDQFDCLDALYVSESGWDMHADNPTSSAYGIPQALTETHDMPPGYFTDAEVQIRWGLQYIQDSYGSPCSAWEFKQANSWY